MPSPRELFKSLSQADKVLRSRAKGCVSYGSARRSLRMTGPEGLGVAAPIREAGPATESRAPLSVACVDDAGYCTVTVLL